MVLRGGGGAAAAAAVVAAAVAGDRPQPGEVRLRRLGRRTAASAVGAVALAAAVALVGGHSHRN